MADENKIFITKASQAKPFIGQKLYWDDVSVRYVFLRSAVLVAVDGRYLEFDNGDVNLPNRYNNLRTFADGGAWLANQKREG